MAKWNTITPTLTTWRLETWFQTWQMFWNCFLNHSVVRTHWSIAAETEQALLKLMRLSTDIWPCNTANRYCVATRWPASSKKVGTCQVSTKSMRMHEIPSTYKPMCEICPFPSWGTWGMCTPESVRSWGRDKFGRTSSEERICDANLAHTQKVTLYLVMVLPSWWQVVHYAPTGSSDASDDNIQFHSND